MNSGSLVAWSGQPTDKKEQPPCHSTGRSSTTPGSGTEYGEGGDSLARPLVVIAADSTGNGDDLKHRSQQETSCQGGREPRVEEDGEPTGGSTGCSLLTAQN